MMTAIMAKRNQIKKIGGGGASVKPNPISSGPKTPSRTSGSVAELSKPPVRVSLNQPQNTAPKPMGGGPKPMGVAPKRTAAPNTLGGALKPETSLNLFSNKTNLLKK